LRAPRVAGARVEAGLHPGVVTRISRSAEDGETGCPAGSGQTKEEDMLFGTVHPAIRAALGVVVLVAGVVLHKVILDVAGAAVVLIGAGQWLYRTRRTGPKDQRR
jgi:hypothetical protein